MEQRPYSNLTQHDLNMKIMHDSNIAIQNGYAQACVDIDKILNNLTSYIYSGNLTEKPDYYYIILFSKETQNQYDSYWMVRNHLNDENYLRIATSVSNGKSFCEYCDLINDFIRERGFISCYELCNYNSRLYNICVIHINLIYQSKILKTLSEQWYFIVNKIKSFLKCL